MSKRKKADRLSERAVAIKEAMDVLSVCSQQACDAARKFTESCNNVMPIVRLSGINSTFSIN